MCDGEGQLAPAKKLLEFVGLFREFFEDHPEYPSLSDARDRRPPDHKAEVVAYLLAGKPMVVSPGGKAADFFDPTRLSTTRSILTDGTFAWHKQLAYYVENYDVALPPHFERHLEAQNYRTPEVDTNTVTLSAGHG